MCSVPIRLIMLVGWIITLYILSYRPLVDDGEASKFAAEQGVPAPVVIIPGDAATPMDARVNRTIAKHNCAQEDGWYRLWLNLKDFMIGKLYCTVENMRLIFDPKTNQSRNPPGIETRDPGWGTAEVVEYLDDSYFARLFHIGDDAVELVEAMVGWGYKKDVSIRGAPYDYRYAMASQPKLFERIRLLVEETSKMNGNRRVALISHSFGGLYATWFLNRQSQAWKDKYIHSFIALSTPWGGSMLSLQALTSGYNYDLSFVDRFLTRKLQRSFESNYMLVPNYKFYKPGTVFIYTKSHNYTLGPDDVDLYFENAKNLLGKQEFHAVRDQNLPKRTEIMPPLPGVETYCMYGTGLDSIKALQYYDFPDGSPKLEYGPGDETVVYESLRGCEHWQEKLPEKGGRYKVDVHEFPGVSHLGIFGNYESQMRIKSILFAGK